MTLIALDRPAAIAAAAKALSDTLTLDAALTRADLNAAMTTAFGTTDATGAWSQRDSFDMLELAQSRYFSQHPDVSAPKLAEFLSRMPTHTVRSEEQIVYQAFSTPIDIAHLAVRLAAITDQDTVLEPSAGTGLLAALAMKKASSVHLNELNPTRYGALRETFPKLPITRYDATKIDTMLASTLRPSVILMNPPFSKDLKIGDDPYAAVRHLRSALRLLSPGGRLVAIMPDWFTNSAKLADIYAKTFANCSVIYSARLGEGAYRKHGTSIAVRLFAIDKTAGNITPVIMQRECALDLSRELKSIPPRQQLGERKILIPIRTAATPVQTPRKALTLPPARTPQRNNVLPVAYTKLETPPPLGDQAGIYIPYRPSRIKFEAAGEHPTALVESLAMASIAMPLPTYTPNLPERIVSERLLSDAQLESLIYANTQWSLDLPGRFRQPENGITLVLDPEGQAYRKGFFLGDGTGAGKGRQVASCIMDQWLNGRRRAIFVSKNMTLIEDFRRDWADLGGLPSDVIPISNWKIDQPITTPEAIIFVPYPTLRSSNDKASRLRQVTEWAKEDFEGVIVFDEAHEMGGVVGKQTTHGKTSGSQQGNAGVALQNALPRARVIYASATGASDVANLGYAVRLGLWGPGTSFDSREAFITAIRDGGIAAMELVARELKSLGQYTARSLSFAGVEYDVLKHQLTPEQIEIYNTYSGAWTIINNNIQAALEATGVVDDIQGNTLNSAAKASALSRFESTRQRFFGQLLLSLKLPTMITDMEQKLAQGLSCVVQIVTTAEAILNRRLGRMSPEEAADTDISLSPLEYVVDYLTRAFPTTQMVEYINEAGEKSSMPLYDSEGRPIHNPAALRMREDLLETICSLPPIPSAIDAILDHFGTDAVAEITGRSRRLIRHPNGTQTIQSRSPTANIAETEAFQNGRKRILVFSDAGGTGRSYHASLNAKNKQRRAHYLAEPGWRSDRAIQGLGRTHRTHQASAPLFILVTTDVRGELRFTSTIARRLDALGALTRGQRQTGGQNLFDPADNLETTYAKNALHAWYQLLVDGKLRSTTLLDFEKMSGLQITEEDGTIAEDLPPITRWLNRILALKIDTQNAIFDEFMALVEARIHAAREAGTLDLGVETIPVANFEVVEDVILRTDQTSGAHTHLQCVKIARRKRPVSLTRASEIIDTHSAQLVRNTKSNRVAIRLRQAPYLTDQGDFITRSTLMHPLRNQHLTDAKIEASNWKPVSRDVFDKLWQAEYDEHVNQIDEELIYLATGLLLPIWNDLPIDFVNVARIAAEDGTTLLGRLIHATEVTNLLKKFGKDAAQPKLSGSQIIAQIERGSPVTLPGRNDLTLKRSLVNGSQRYEVSTYPHTLLPALKNLGCYTEIIAYRSRVFFDPAKADEIVRAIIDLN